MEWGVLTAFVMRVVQPVIADFVAAIPGGEFAATLLLAYLAVESHDYGAAYPAVQRKAGIPQRSACAAEKARGNEALCFPTGNDSRFESMPAAEFLREFKETMAEENERLELREEERLRRQLVQEEIKEKLECWCLQKSSLIERVDACIPGIAV